MPNRWVTQSHKHLLRLLLREQTVITTVYTLAFALKMNLLIITGNSSRAYFLADSVYP